MKTIGNSGWAQVRGPNGRPGLAMIVPRRFRTESITSLEKAPVSTIPAAPGGRALDERQRSMHVHFHRDAVSNRSAMVILQLPLPAELTLNVEFVLP